MSDTKENDISSIKYRLAKLRERRKEFKELREKAHKEALSKKARACESANGEAE